MVQCRNDFPILKRRINEKPLIYLDNAATMQIPKSVMERMEYFYSNENANIHRGLHTLSNESTFAYESVRKIVCEFLGTDDSEEIIFTSGTTASINMVVAMLSEKIEAGDEIILSTMEHHSNMLPWMRLAKEKGAVIKLIPILSTGTLDLDWFYNVVGERTKICALTELSNVTGIKNPLDEMIRHIRKETKAFVLVDGAQGIVHGSGLLKTEQPDFYCFSGHKLGAPTGTGILWIARKIQTILSPAWQGGGTVSFVSFSKIEYLDSPSRFEAGTQNYAGIIGLGEALKYWIKQRSIYGMEQINRHEEELIKYLEEGLASLPGVHVLGVDKEKFGSISFWAESIHPYDFCHLLDLYGVAARSGHLCAQPYLNALGVENCVRFSIAPYNTREEITQVLDYCREILQYREYSLMTSSGMELTMNELEKDIIKDLEELNDPMMQYSYLTACAANCIEYPKRLLSEQYLIPQCPVKTWMADSWLDNKYYIFFESESIVVKGALAIIQEIYMNRTPDQIKNYKCSLLSNELFIKHLNQEQLYGLREILKRIKQR